MTDATLANILTVLIAAAASFIIVDIVKRGRHSRVMTFLTHLASLVGLASASRTGAAPLQGKAGRDQKPARLKGRPGRVKGASKRSRKR
ncbi:MAG: hypothetical protein JWN93_353 [Hyphomicrobiales bacterium]|nr:hypothetical protein [Hyphomicrobiales bacterium]